MNTVNFKKAETPTGPGGIFGNNKSLGNPKLQSKTSSMADILNLLNARANANVSPQAKIDEVPNLQKTSENPINPIPPLLSFPALMGNQKTNPFLLNLLKQSEFLELKKVIFSISKNNSKFQMLRS